jgi:hypothetical protein
VADETPGATPEERAYRRGFRQRNRQDDYALDLFREVRTHLGDPERVDRILLELGRYYNPLVDGPIVDVATRRRIVMLLRQAQRDEAERLLDERFRCYAPLDETRSPDTPAQGEERARQRYPDGAGP